MKKISYLLFVTIFFTNTYSQNLTSKKGEPILPEKGDWSVGIDANPFLSYLGNFFNKSATSTNGTVTVNTPNQSPSWNFLTTNQTFTGKYFVDDHTAYRGSLRIGFSGNSIREVKANRMITPNVASNNGFPNAAFTIENITKYRNTSIGLSAGIEKRKGKTRLQGYYGAEVGLYLNAQKRTFNYGNALAVNLSPTGPTQPTNVSASKSDSIASFSNVVSAVGIFQGSTAGDTARLTKYKYGTTLSFGVRLFVGAEFFIFPKISIGGEFGWSLGFSTTGKSEASYEAVGRNGTSNASIIGNTTIKGARQGSFAIDNDSRNSVWGSSGSLRLNFYF
jgi:hypothetical protein